MRLLQEVYDEGAANVGEYPLWCASRPTSMWWAARPDLSEARMIVKLM
jgi:hypothetical protein